MDEGQGPEMNSDQCKPNSMWEQLWFFKQAPGYQFPIIESAPVNKSQQPHRGD